VQAIKTPKRTSTVSLHGLMDDCSIGKQNNLLLCLHCNRWVEYSLSDSNRYPTRADFESAVSTNSTKRVFSIPNWGRLRETSKLATSFYRQNILFSRTYTCLTLIIKLPCNLRAIASAQRRRYGGAVGKWLVPTPPVP